MRRAPVAGPDLGIYLRALPLLVRTPSIVVVPLMMAVLGILVGEVLAPLGGGIAGQLTGGLAGFLVFILELFGLGAACVIADDAWRHGRASFDRGWSEARRRGSELFMAAFGVAIVLSAASFVTPLFGALVADVLAAIAVVFLIWVMPAAAIGGVPGGAALGISIERVRETPLPAIVAAVVAIALLRVAVPYAAVNLFILVAPYGGSLSPIIFQLITALLQAIAMGYIALIVTKTYADVAFGRR
jgi:hypothetical protein